MFSAIRNRIHITPSTVIATVALVFVMTGGAYAASHYLITSTKQISPKVLKQLRGKAGPAGPEGKGITGPAGKDGANGTNGANGKDGSNGKDGVSVTSSTEPAGANCKAGGSKLVAANGTTYACNGANGQTGFTETLPSEKAERGVWSVLYSATAAGQLMQATMSFNIPLAEAPEAKQLTNYIGTEEGEGEPNENKGAIPSHCKGTIEAPVAQPGNLCVFVRTAINVKTGGLGALFFDPQGGTGEAAGPGGAVMDFSAVAAGVVFADGVWAVTAA
jgi:hypothetical protein